MNRLPLRINMVLAFCFALQRGSYAVAPIGTLEKDFPFHANRLFLDPNLPFLYATTDSGLQIIDTRTLSVSKSLTLPTACYDMSISPNGSSLYISGGTSASLFVVNTQSQNLQTTVPVGGFPSTFVQSVATGPNNRMFVLVDSSAPYYDYALEQIDVSTGASAGPNIPVNPYSGTLQISRDRQTLYYATFGLSPGSLYKVDVSTPTPNIVWSSWAETYAGNGNNLILSHDGSLIAYVGGYGYMGYNIPEFVTQDMSLKGVLSTGAYPGAMAFSPDDKLEYALQTSVDVVDVYDTATANRIGQFPVAGDGYGALVDQSGQDIFVSLTNPPLGSGDLVVYSTGIAVPEPSPRLLFSAGSLALILATMFRRLD
jgi:DNA-binding beta-propeller fold protein YncE